MNAMTTAPAPARRPLGLSVPAVLGLALLGVPRVILHDLGVLQPGSLANALLVFVPVLLWIGSALLVRVPRPLLTLLVIGAAYGVLLALCHQLLWGASFPGPGPRLGGNLADLPPLAHAVVIRGAAVLSSLVTGVVVGVVCGLVAELAALLLRGAPRTGR